MHKLMRTAAALLCGMTISAGFVSCDDDNDDPFVNTHKEETLQAAVTPYVNNTVIATYRAMADAACNLYDDCVIIQQKFANGTLTSADVQKAGDDWKRSREQWELSEAFLYGPAGDHNIDPHIDSWPLDQVALDDQLAKIRRGEKWEMDNGNESEDYYGLIGYHALEYCLFELSEDGNSSLPHSLNYTAEELVYLVNVAYDLRNWTIALEAAWAGFENITPEKLGYLTAYKLDQWNDKRGDAMILLNTNLYTTYQACAEEIIQGCIDIADEVANTKMGRPNLGANEEDRNYIESPYSLNSINDFQNNIRSIQNAYCGIKSGDASISDYIKSVDPALDTEVREAITASINAIGQIKEPFAKTARDAECDNAIDTVNDKLITALEKVMVELTRYGA